MTYTVKEIFYTLQGEGAQTGAPAVFLRFAGCNLWTGLEKDRAKAQCQFCDTDFIGGTKFKTAEELAKTVSEHWPEDITNKMVVCTGGEPLLQLDTPLIDALHAEGFKIAVESNGTQIAPKGIDWLCISPKADCEIVQTSGDELKLVFPQAEISPAEVEHLDFKNFFLQPMDNEFQAENTKMAVDYCKAHPKWRLSIQTHKLIDIP
ncbi:MAG: 7-carboxy-7-deazaguanine synthase [Sphingomonadales bacterium]|nr:7-carboxy-7-deazaguanine synthase [Sphingomonadales bacterium]